MEREHTWASLLAFGGGRVVGIIGCSAFGGSREVVCDSSHVSVNCLQRLARHVERLQKGCEACRMVLNDLQMMRKVTGMLAEDACDGRLMVKEEVVTSEIPI